MAQGHWMERNGRRVAWSEGGEGPPLLLLQGYSGTAADWDPTFLAGLESVHRVVRPDHRGMGGSTFGDPTEELTISSMAADALAVLDHLDIDRAVVAGWSMGGYVAQALTCLQVERVTGMALIGTAPGGPSAVSSPDPTAWQRLTDDSGTPREQATRLLHVLFPGPVADRFDAQVGDLVAEARAQLDPQVLRAQEAAIVAWHTGTPPAVPADPPPVLAIGGSDDVVIPDANVDRLAAMWPGCRTVVVAGAGHAVMAQEPERVATLINDLG
jgi:pimeloyl-ACP methyl ester carboxylesterase